MESKDNLTMVTPRIRITYVTSSEFKVAEQQTCAAVCRLSNGLTVGQQFEFDIRQVAIKEVLEVDLQAMVTAEVKSAYSQIRVPCIVEHAGLIFEDYKVKSYPGGLTKAMWNALQDQFIEETHLGGRSAIARAVVAYCDGMSIQTFVGETTGTIALQPRGERKFYWDTIFIPDDPNGETDGKTYAEIVGDTRWGLEYKMAHLSQSSKALCQFLEHRLAVGEPELWGLV